jgi:hypothetical protein
MWNKGYVTMSVRIGSEQASEVHAAGSSIWQRSPSGQ